MRKLVESTFMTLDGVISSPGEWGQPYWNDEHNDYAGRLTMAADALLLGRKTYELFAKAWPPQTADEGSRRMNAMPKYVPTTTLSEATWNATLIKRDIPAEIAKLKAQPGQSILKYGTGVLDKLLLEHDLVDEFHFWIFPVFLGKGERLFAGFDMTTLKLVDSSSFSTGIVVNTYVPARK
jgi:dihydrofolate reductase